MDTRNPYLYTGEVETTWSNPDAFNPYLHPSRHPELPCGINAFAINACDLNGSGVNEPVWPFWWDAYDSIWPVVFPADYLNVFDSTCPDLTVGAVGNVVTIPPPPRNLCIKKRA